MQVYIGSDHGGFSYKAELLNWLHERNYPVTDCGDYKNEPSDDYPDFAFAVSRAVAEHPEGRGILLCRSGEGMEMAANKVPGVRAALVWDTKVAVETRHDNDANVLVLPADFLSQEQIIAIVEAFLTTDFSKEERHIRRLQKLHAIEHISYEG